MKWFLLFIFMTVFGITAYAQPLERDVLLEKMVNVYGGEQALKKAHTFMQEWEVTAMMSGEKGTDHRKVSLPNARYIDLNYPSRSETRMLKDALFRHEGNVSAVARQFGITRRAVHKKIKNCGIDCGVYRQRGQRPNYQ